MKKIPQRTIFHEVIEKKIPKRRQCIAVQANNIPVPDTPDCFEFGLEFSRILNLSIESLYRNRSGIFQRALVNRTGRSVSDNVLFVQILGDVHYIVERMNRHVHVKNDKLWRTYNHERNERNKLQICYRRN